MISENLEFIYQEYLPCYKKQVKDFQESSLLRLIQKSSKEAKSVYRKLKSPKTCSLGLFVDIWVRKKVSRDLSERTFHLNKLPLSFDQAIEGYFSLLPFKKIYELEEKIFESFPQKRKEIWKSYNLPTKEIEQRFSKVAAERNKIAKKRGYQTYTELFLEKYKISYAEYAEFIKNAEKAIQICNRFLPDTRNTPRWFYSEFNIPCFICRMPSFPVKSFDEVFNNVCKTFKILARFREKIDIRAGEDSHTYYCVRSDRFRIIIAKDVNLRHQLVDLIHELSHVILNLKNFRKEGARDRA